MATLMINGVPYRMAFNMAALEEAEQVFGGLREMQEAVHGVSARGQMWTIIELTRILINAGRMADAVEYGTAYKPITHEFLAVALPFGEIGTVKDMIMDVIADGMHARQRDNGDEDRDLSTEALKKETAG